MGTTPLVRREICHIGPDRNDLASGLMADDVGVRRHRAARRREHTPSMTMTAT